jgi:hypothetical protein
MPGPILHTGAIATCPHGGSLQIMAASPRVVVGGMPAAVLTDQGMVAGCVFQIPVGAGTKPQPCVTTRWIAGATRVTADNVVHGGELADRGIDAPKTATAEGCCAEGLGLGAGLGLVIHENSVAGV